jgi:O-antigen ligase
LKSNGSPARLVGLICLGLWFVSQFAGRGARSGGGLARASLLTWGAAAILAFGTASGRALTSVESAGAVRAVAAGAAALGIGLLVADTLGRRETIERLLSLVVLGATFSAVVGIGQFAVALDWAGLVRPPGFTVNGVVELSERLGYRRALGTATHPIEFGVVLGALLPLAAHFALHGRSLAERRLYAACAAIMIVAIPMGVSRAAVLSTAVAVGFYSLVCTWRQRVNALLLVVVGAVLSEPFVSGLAKALLGLFRAGGSDPSIAGRTRDYGPIRALIDQSPVFGRGLGTFRPDQYFYLDNQFLLVLVEAGLIGLAAHVLLYLGGVTAARACVHRSAVASRRSLAQAVAAGLTAMFVCGVTFDSFAFAQVLFLTFLLVGAAAALRSLAVREAEPVETGTDRWRARVAAERAETGLVS